MPGTDGTVLAVARTGHTLYIAGSFRSVGENSGGLVPTDADIGGALRGFPKVAGSVYAVAPNGTGGWYLGGDFTAVGGRPRWGVAEITAEGNLSEWTPSVTGSTAYLTPPTVLAIAVSGTRVYLGGAFSTVGGLPRRNAACVDAHTGAVLDWAADTHAGAWLYTLAMYDSTVFLGGYFSSVNGQPRSNLAAVNATTGAVESWQADAGGSVWSLLTRGDTLIAGGEFGSIAGQSRFMLAELDVRAGTVLPFDARPSGIFAAYMIRPQVRALALVGDTLFVAGNFTQIGGQARTSVAALDVTSGNALPWTPQDLGPTYDGVPPPLVQSIAVDAGRLFMAGGFNTVGSEIRPSLAALDRATGQVTAWNPGLNQSVYTLAAGGNSVLVGGAPGLLTGWKHRAGLAAIDLTTGAVKPWNPNPDGRVVTAVAVVHGRVIVSGGFHNIGGQSRTSFASLDTLNGEADSWNPVGNGEADAIVIVGDTLYAGGYFTQVGGLTRNYLAAIDLTTGGVTSWDPDASWPVLAMARRENTIYVGGVFNQLGSQIRRGIAAIDATTGQVMPWDPDANGGIVEALLVSGSTVYVGGAFNQIGGQVRQSLAAIDAVSGFATPWDPRATEWDVVSPWIYAMGLRDSLLYVGGSFATIGGQPRVCLAALDTATALATDWDPGMDGRVWSLEGSGDEIYAGGGFARADGLPSEGLAAFSFPRELAPIPRSLGLAQSVPNPAHSTANIRFSLPSAAATFLVVYDVQGRRLATPLNGAVLEAGSHDVTIQLEGWNPGVYLYRLDAGGRTVTRKILVVR